MALVFKMVVERGKKGYKQMLIGLPYLFTFANVLFGFLSILESIELNFQKAACFIGLAACMDLLDGRIARALGCSSFLGGQLDALCDAISFCMAPCVLLFSLYDVSIESFAFAALSVYLCAGVFRLARFNTTPINQDVYFVGLPTTMAAFTIGSCVLYYDWLVINAPWLITSSAIWYIVIALAALMTSSIKFPAAKKLQIKWQYAYLALLLSMLIVWVCYTYTLPLLLIGFVAYCSAPVVYHILKIAKRS